MKKRNICLLIIVILCAAALKVFWDKTEPHPQEVQENTEENTSQNQEKDDDHEMISLTLEQAKAFGIQTQQARPGSLSCTLFTRGKIVLHPDRLAHILPKVSGVVKKTLKNIGDTVGDHEILAILESQEIADIKAEYLTSLKREHFASYIFEKESALYQKKISTEQDYLNAKSSYEEAKIALQLSKQKLHTLGFDEQDLQRLAQEHSPDLRFYEIRSPLEGIVIDRDITNGEFIEDTATIYEIADLNTVWVEIGIYPHDLLKTKEGQIITITHPVTQKSAQAKITYLSPFNQWTFLLFQASSDH